VDRERAFVIALGYTRRRISLFLSLPFARLEKASLTAKVREIGHVEGASSPRSSVA